MPFLKATGQGGAGERTDATRCGDPGIADHHFRKKAVILAPGTWEQEEERRKLTCRACLSVARAPDF
jgi:hypothetical protein